MHIAPLLDRRNYFEHSNRGLTVAAADPAVIHLLQTAYGPLRRDRAPSASRHAKIERVACGLRLRYGSGLATYCTSEFGAFGATFRAVRDLFAQYCVDVCGGAAFYGACGAYGGGAFALFGESGAGKTMLLLHLAVCGARFLGDETFTLTYDGCTIRALARLPALREPGLRLLPNAEMREAVLTSPDFEQFERGRFWYALRSEHLLGIAPDSAPYALTTAFFLERSSASAALETLNCEQTLACAIRRMYRKPRTLEELVRLRAALRGVRGYRIRLDEPARAARRILGVLQCAS